MRILLVNYEYPPLGGGGGVLTRTLANELSRRHEVTVLTSRAGDLPKDAYEGHVRVVRTAVAGRRELERASTASLLSFVPSGRRTGAWLARTHYYDVVHTFFAVPTGPAGAAIARRAKAPHVLTVIGADVYDPSRLDPSSFAPLRAVVRRIILRADAVTAISRDIADRAVTLSGRNGIRVIAPGIPAPPMPAADRRSLGWHEDEFVVVTVARLVKRKALDVLVHATAAMDGVRLEIVGEGPQRDALESIAPREHVRFHGSLPDEEIRRLLVSANAFALVSLHEGFGLVYLEAMQARLPIVAGTIGGQTDFLVNGKNALLVPPGDEDALRAAIARLRDDHDLRVHLRAAAHTSAQHFTAETMAEEYLAVYRSVTHSGAPLTHGEDDL